MGMPRCGLEPPSGSFYSGIGKSLCINSKWLYKDARKVLRHATFDLGAFDRPAKEAGERGDAAVGDAAGHDQREILEVRGDVEREAVARHPPADPHANRRELLLPDPYAREAFDAPGVAALLRHRPYPDLFEIGHA